MIPMVDLKKQFEPIKDEVIRVTVEIIESGRYVLGRHVEMFEEETAGYLGTGQAIGVASGTDALHLSLKAIGIGPGDEVITTPFTFFATAEAIIYQGAKPVFVDIEPDTFNINPELIEERITSRTKAILPVHVFGLPADMPRIQEIARKHGLKVVEDCAQSFGASINGKKTGSFGEAGCFSFYPSKNLGAYGDGGLISVSDGPLAADMRMLRNHGQKGGYVHNTIGFNSRLDELQAGILLIKLRHIDQYNDGRRTRAALYNKLLSGSVKCPQVEPKAGFHHVFHQYTILHPERDALKEKLAAAGVSSMVYYPVPLHLQPALKHLGHAEGDMPVAERVCREVLSLPIYPELEDAEVERIAEIIKGA